MNYRVLVVAVLGAVALGVGAVAFAASSPPPATTPTLAIAGASGNGLVLFPPLKLTMAQLAALRQTNMTVTIDGATLTETGPSVSSLLTLAGFAPIGTCRNDFLRYWVEASSLNGSAAEITDAELDPNFGNRPAILSLNEN